MNIVTYDIGEYDLLGAIYRIWSLETHQANEEGESERAYYRQSFWMDERRRIEAPECANSHLEREKRERIRKRWHRRIWPAGSDL